MKKDVVIGCLLVLLGIALPFVGFAPRIFINDWNGIPDYIKAIFNPISWTIAGYGCLYFAKKYFARAGRDSGIVELLEEDPRPPIVYIRSFAADKKGDKPLYLKGETQEEVVASVFRKAGPFIAIGNPDENFPTLGASRWYVKDDWKTTIITLMSEAQFVVMRVGESKGLLWELDWSVKHLLPERLLLIVPSGRKKYEAFCLKTQNSFPSPLPDYPIWKITFSGIKGIVYFESDWTAHFLTFKHAFLRGSIFNPLPRGLQALLLPVFKHLGIPWHNPPVNWVRVSALGLLALIIIYALSAAAINNSN